MNATTTASSPLETLRHYPGLLKAGDLAEICDEPKAVVYAWHREHGMPGIRFGRALRFDGKAVAEWMESGGTSANGGA
ncbi:MAG: helix-turn-helix domain-containing protein [Gemmatimonadota bacterium]